jgi:hypothetical protein
MRTDRQADMTKLIVDFCGFANAPKNRRGEWKMGHVWLIRSFRYVWRTVMRGVNVNQGKNTERSCGVARGCCGGPSLLAGVTAHTETATSLHPSENSSDRAAGYRFPVVFALHVTGIKSNPYAVAVRLASQQPTSSSLSSGYVTAARAGR